MLNKKNLADRVKKSKKTDVVMINRNEFIVRGSEDQYRVRFVDGNRAICVNTKTSEFCNGNHRSVCYHVFAALVTRAMNSPMDVRVAFCANKEDASRLARIGRTFHRVTNGLRSAEVWLVIFDRKMDVADIQSEIVNGCDVDAIVRARISHEKDAEKTMREFAPNPPLWIDPDATMYVYNR